jgi:hypothetical protein
MTRFGIYSSNLILFEFGTVGRQTNLATRFPDAYFCINALLDLL